MKNKELKTIALKKEAVSFLNNNQMNFMLGGERNLSFQTQNGGNCDSWDQCCTMFADCKTIEKCNSDACPSYTPNTCTGYSVCVCGSGATCGATCGASCTCGSDNPFDTSAMYGTCYGCG